MESAICPFCHLSVPSSELERHADCHFEDEELARDMELAQKLAVALSSPPEIVNNQANSEILYEEILTEIPESSITRRDGLTRSTGELQIDEKISCLTCLQIRSTFYKVEDGIMALLTRCLELEAGNSTSILSGYIDHFQCTESEDVGWGCGWRNIQMLSSNLLMQRKEAREVLFGGSGFVPDIPSLQRWLEVAWEKGFDVPGSEHFNKKIYGSTKWIGTTECAALFRSFGLRARIMDFGPKEFESLSISVPGSSCAQGRRVRKKGKRKAGPVYGPMDKYLSGSNHDISKSASSDCVKIRSSSVQLNRTLGCGNSEKLIDDSSMNSRGHQILIDWVWNYFNDKSSTESCRSRIVVSDKAPLYFQHDGHSRTIVGIQAKRQQSGIQQYSLLILDPAHRTTGFERSLKENFGWQKLIKRGGHTLKKPQYQICYIDQGIATWEEMEKMKTIDSVFLEF